MFDLPQLLPVACHVPPPQRNYPKQPFSDDHNYRKPLQSQHSPKHPAEKATL